MAEHYQSLIGTRVVHDRKYGTGTIVAVDRRYVLVDFDNFDSPKEFPVNSDYVHSMGGATIESVIKNSIENRKIEELLSNRKKICNYLTFLKSEYGFEGFVHYTAFDNFVSIMKDGFILSRDEMLEEHRKWIDVAEASVLEKTPEKIKHGVRLSYGFNTPISYQFEQHAKKAHTELVALVFDRELVLDEDIWFFEKSAARGEYGDPTQDYSEIRHFAWEKIFQRGSMNFDDRVAKQYRDAEIVVNGSLTLDHLYRIYFRSDNCFQKAIEEFGGDKRFMKGKVEVFKHFTPGVRYND